MENLSNNISTNKFESFTGALNIAPVKLSGTYKIFVDKNNNLFLDDYSGRQVKIDKNQKFLPQVANFLKTKTIFQDSNLLKYGGFRYDKQLAYHCPMYLNDSNTLPNYFVVSRILNETINDSNDLHKYNDIIKIYDLQKIGLKNIFNEIINQYDYILNFNWEESLITINGFSIDQEVNVKKTFNILYNQANQTNLEVLNNNILNTFKNNNIIFPKFINVEFEFEYENNKTPFNNFFGYLSIGNTITKQNFVDSITTISFLDYNTKIDFKQEKEISLITEIPFLDIVSNSKITIPKNKNAQCRIKIDNISVGDYIKIKFPNNTTYFEYYIIQSDLKQTLRETLKYISNKLTNLSDRNLDFTVDISTNILTIKFNILDLNIEDYFITTSQKFVFVDNTNKFCRLLNNDIIISQFQNNNLYQKVSINNIIYNIVKIFLFDNELIIRLDNLDNRNIPKNTYVEIFQNKLSSLLQLKPIPYLSYNSDFNSLLQYDKTSYYNELKKTFTTNTSIIAQEKFNDINKFVDNLQYTIDQDFLLQQNNNVVLDNNTYNDINILNMNFCSSGTTAYITPNILNIDKRFYDNNGNPDFNLIDSDKLKFHWFLIKSKTPQYLENDVRNFRYFTNKPKLTSRLIINEENLDFCETIFLGVKYRMPQKYKNYQFAVYLNFEDEIEIDLNYKFEVNDVEKTVYLSINKYLDFIDLLRGGEITNEPLIDLSFFYCVQESHNTNSQSLYAFKTGGVLICDEEKEVMYDNNIITDWKYQEINPVTGIGKWYVCLKRSYLVITAPFTELFPDSGDVEFYVYSSIMIDNVKHDYISMTFKIKNIHILKDDYLWCEDISIKFFDTKNYFINVYNSNQDIPDGIINVPENNIISSIPTNNTFFGNQTVISTILVDSTNQQFKLINYSDFLSLKENYFELIKNNIYDSDGFLTTTEGKFFFPEFKFPTLTYTQLYNLFNNDSLDNATYFSKISLFDRNQLWKIIKDVLQTDIKFKHTTAKQTYNLIHEFLISRLKEFCDLENIQIKNSEPLTDNFIKLNVIENDINTVIWQTYPEVLPRNNNGIILQTPKIHKINRYGATYLPYLKELNNELEFQAEITTNKNKTFINIYDKDFYGPNINVTGNLKEVMGNITSSLFSKTENLTFELTQNDNLININLIDNLKPIINIDEFIIINKNENYISTINNNIDEYIRESSIKWLLLNVYKLDSIKNELGQKIDFVFVNQTNFLINLKTKIFEKAIFNFIRK